MPPTGLDPQHQWREPVRRGQLIRLAARGPDQADANATLTFQYNPETVTRSRSGRWEPRQAGRSSRQVQTPQEVRRLGAHGASAVLAESETISFRVMFDATEAILRGEEPEDEPNRLEVGILPELAFLELVSLGRDVEERQRRPRQGTEIRPIRPDELLLRLEDRWFPCVLTELTITEQRFSPRLVPVRAEADVQLKVLEPVESTYSRFVGQAFAHLMDGRIRQSESLAGATSATTLEDFLRVEERP